MVAPIIALLGGSVAIAAIAKALGKRNHNEYV